jgi:DNA-directed RNA polymerase I subunit RPA2
METHNCGVEIVAPHIESFNDFLHYGLKRLISPTGPLKVLKIIDSDIIHIWLKNPNVFFPINQYKSHSHHPLYPKECRITGLTYKGDFTVDICYTINSEKTYSFTKKMGKIPIMIRSNACWLKKATKKQLISLGEEGNEFGGYFLCNGIEKLIRMTISTRRNYVMALRMSSYKKKGINFTDAACLIRCVRSDHMSQLLRTHYLTNGTVLVAFTYSGAEHIIPVGILIKSLGGITDKEIFEQLVSPISGSIKESKNESKNHNSFVSDRVELLLRQTSRSGLLSQNQNLAYLGHKFRKILDFQNNETDINCGIKVLKEAVLFHLDNFEAKLNILFIMLKKLFALVNHQCCEDNPDVLVHHEIMLPGAMLSKMIGEKMKENLDLACYQWKEFQIFPKKAHQDQLSIRKLMEKMSDVGKKVEYFISTGNFISKSGLELYQVSGFTVVADRLNFYRYLSHFRSVHRGAYFSENHTTTVRKLTPESWGFLCPVHTPDGAPCGLLNHLTANCYVARQIINTHKTRKMITLGILDLGVIPSLRLQNSNISDRFLTVQLDGHLLGFIHITRVTALIVEVRRLKAVNLRLYTSYSKTKVPWHLEILYVSYKREETYPGLFLFTQDARMIRPVLQLPSKELEYIGPLEQQFMDIACPDNNNKGSPGLKFTHIEIDACQILSVIASLIPYSDYNQSPRNIYQCQMSKQAIGNPVHNLECRTEHSIFVLDNAQTPVARTQAYIRQNMDEYPNGVNAVVAVIANTAYDMEDAMIINKKSMEMGIARARIYKTEFVQLADKTPLAVCDSNDQKWNNQSNYSPPPLRRKNAYTSPQDLHTTPSTIDCLFYSSQQDRITKTQFRNFDIDGLPYPGSIVHPDGLINPWDPSIKNNKHKKKKRVMKFHMLIK